MTRNFTKDEVSCKCGCGLEMPQNEQDRLQHTRDDYGKAIFVARTISCAKHNKKIGGAKKSRHLTGDAVDPEDRTFENSADRAFFIKCATKNGYNCFGIGGKRLHMDARYEDKFEIVLLWTY